MTAVLKPKLRRHWYIYDSFIESRMRAYPLMIDLTMKYQSKRGGIYRADTHGKKNEIPYTESCALKIKLCLVICDTLTWPDDRHVNETLHPSLPEENILKISCSENYPKHATYLPVRDRSPDVTKCKRFFLSYRRVIVFF